MTTPQHASSLTPPSPIMPPSASVHSTPYNDVNAGWIAELKLGFIDRGDKTVLKHRSQKGPLSIQRPLYPEKNICHVYLLHPPGGVVGGDSLTIDVQVESGAHTLITTPGATKFYRSDNKLAKQTQTLVVEDGATLEWLPQENIFFPDSHAKVNTHIYLTDKSRFMGWEMHCFGRPALNEGFDIGAITGKTAVFINQQRVLTEQIKLIGEDKLFSINGLRDCSMTASFFITNTDDELFELVQSLLNAIQGREKYASLILGITHIEGLIIIRALGEWSETILAAFSEIWQQVRQVWLGSAAELPRIWAT
nr:urease accessory protein UreD [Vibrio sp. 10N.286.48.B7]